MTVATEQARQIIARREGEKQARAYALARLIATDAFKGDPEEVIATLDEASWTFDDLNKQVAAIQASARDAAIVDAGLTLAADLAKIDTDLQANARKFAEHKRIADERSHELASRRNQLLAQQYGYTEAQARLRNSFAARYPTEAAELARLNSERTVLAIQARDLSKLMQPSSSTVGIGGKLAAAKSAVQNIKTSLRGRPGSNPDETAPELEQAEATLAGVQKRWDGENQKLEQLRQQMADLDKEIAPIMALEMKV